jgi:hypothetical protein
LELEPEPAMSICASGPAAPVALSAEGRLVRSTMVQSSCETVQHQKLLQSGYRRGRWTGAATEAGRVHGADEERSCRPSRWKTVTSRSRQVLFLGERCQGPALAIYKLTVTRDERCGRRLRAREGYWKLPHRGDMMLHLKQ